MNVKEQIRCDRSAGQVNYYHYPYFVSIMRKKSIRERGELVANVHLRNRHGMELRRCNKLPAAAREKQCAVFSYFNSTICSFSNIIITQYIVHTAQPAIQPKRLAAEAPHNIGRRNKYAMYCMASRSTSYLAIQRGKDGGVGVNGWIITQF